MLTLSPSLCSKDTASLHKHMPHFTPKGKVKVLCPCSQSYQRFLRVFEKVMAPTFPSRPADPPFPQACRVGFCSPTPSSGYYLSPSGTPTSGHCPMMPPESISKPRRTPAVLKYSLQATPHQKGPTVKKAWRSFTGASPGG